MLPEPDTVTLRDPQQRFAYDYLASSEVNTMHPRVLMNYFCTVLCFIFYFCVAIIFVLWMVVSLFYRLLLTFLPIMIDACDEARGEAPP